MLIRNAYPSLSRRARTFIAVVAVVASCASLSAVVTLFDSAGSTPWFAADQAGLVVHCTSLRAATQRHACLQTAARQDVKTRVAAR